MCSSPFLNLSPSHRSEIDKTLENMSAYRKNKWIIEGKLRRYFSLVPVYYQHVSMDKFLPLNTMNAGFPLSHSGGLAMWSYLLHLQFVTDDFIILC